MMMHAYSMMMQVYCMIILTLPQLNIEYDMVNPHKIRT